MKDELFDKKVKELADSYAEAPDIDVWDGIESGLRRRKWTVLLRRAASLSAAAAALFGLFVAVSRQDFSNGPEHGVIAVAEMPEPESGTGMSAVGAVHAGPVLTPVPEVTAGVVSVSERQALRPVRVSLPKPEDVFSGTDVAEGEDDTSDRISGVGAVRSDKPSIYDYENVRPDYIAMVSEVPEMPEARKRSSFSLDASGHLSPTDATGNVDFSLPSYSWGMGEASVGEGMGSIYDIRHYFPVSVGLELKYSFLNDRLGVGLGVNYTFLISDYQALVSMSSARFQGSVRQSIHYIGVPLNLYVTILSGKRLSFYANAGCMLEKAVRASYDITDLYSNRYRKDINPEGVQWSANIGLGLECRIFDFMGLFVDPRLTYFFDCDQPYTVRAEQPLQFNLEVGFRFHI